jgi:hypothetical protein
VCNLEVCIADIALRIKELATSQVTILGNAANGNLGHNFKKLDICLLVDEYINASKTESLHLI